MYPGLVPFFHEAEERVADPGWLCHCMGRIRRFPPTKDRGMLAEFGRVGKNFPIQGMVASAVNRAVAYLTDYKLSTNQPDLFRILLQIHDALLLEARYEDVPLVAQKILPWAMRQMIPIYPTTLSGMPTGAGPYRLGIDVGVSHHWGQYLTEEEAHSYGLREKTWAGDGVVVAYYK